MFVRIDCFRQRLGNMIHLAHLLDHGRYLPYSTLVLSLGTLANGLVLSRHFGSTSTPTPQHGDSLPRAREKTLCLQIAMILRLHLPMTGNDMASDSEQGTWRSLSWLSQCPTMLTQSSLVSDTSIAVHWPFVHVVDNANAIARRQATVPRP